MGTTAQKLKKLLDNKRAIRDAITEKTGEDAGEVMSTYAEKIMAIEGGGTKYFRTTILLDQTITDPAAMITKVYDDGGISQIRENSHCYVCNMFDGVMQAKQLMDSNRTIYRDGSASSISGANGDVFMKLPEFWYKAWSEESNKWYITFAYGAAPDSSYKHWDGKDFIGVYEAYISNDMLYSRSGVTPSVNKTQAAFKSYANNRGEGYSLVRWKHHSIMAFLFYAWYLNTDSQNVVGSGVNSIAKTTGQTDQLGMEDTIKSINGNSQSINFWGLENWWDDVYEFIDNISADSATGLWTITEDDGETRAIQASISGGYALKFLVGDMLDALPIDVAGSDSTGYCAQFYVGSGVGTSTAVARSCSHNDPNGGIASLFVFGNSEVYSSISSRLAYRGEYVIIE